MNWRELERLALFRRALRLGLPYRCIAIELQCQLLHIAVLFSEAGIRPARFLFPVWEGFVPSAGIFCSQGGNDFPQMTGKAAAVPLSLNNTDFHHKDLYLLGGHRFWRVRSMADLGSKLA